MGARAPAFEVPELPAAGLPACAFSCHSGFRVLTPKSLCCPVVVLCVASQVLVAHTGAPGSVCGSVPPSGPAGGITLRQGPARSRQDVRPRASEVGASPSGLRGHVSLRSVTGAVRCPLNHELRVRDLVSQGPCEDLLCSCVVVERDACWPLRRRSCSCWWVCPRPPIARDH